MNIDMKDFINLLKNKYILNIIDIREYNLYLKSHIENAINIEESILRNNPFDYLDKNKLYYIYCRFGGKSFFLSKELNTLGFNTVNIEGGYKEYLVNK